MKTDRRQFLLAGASAGAALLLPGCGGPDRSVTANFGSGTGYDGPPVELSFWNGFTGGDGPNMLAMIDEFAKQQKNVTVNMVTARWEDFYQKVPAAVSSGQGPDVAIMHVDQLATNAAHDAILPLDDLVEGLGLQESDFAPEVWRAGEVEGRRYGVPLDMHPLALYSNTAVLEEAGLDPKQPPTNREEYEAALEELKGKGIQGGWVTPFFFTGGLQFMSLLWQFGGELTDAEGTRATWNSDAGVEALEWLLSLVDRGYSPRNVGQDADNIAFKNGESAYMWNGAWGIADYGSTEGFKFETSPLPQIGSERAAWSNSHNFVIARPRKEDPNRLQAAKVFIDFITKSPTWAESGMIPARSGARESEAFKKLAPQVQIAKQIPDLHFQAAVPGLSDVRESTLDQAIAQAVNGEKSARKALDDSVKRANDLLARNREAYAA
jgi:multiple sugar transport system substrate-binding protein